MGAEMDLIALLRHLCYRSGFGMGILWRGLWWRREGLVWLCRTAGLGFLAFGLVASKLRHGVGRSIFSSTGRSLRCMEGLQERCPSW
ncbi:hypothetical protein BU23DRAFT_152124 [Bimuria novae-zelandiae CBS 107.79]|uniref:Uncharacterized protein n=1 Tax=Bimuria novae-zelandiae CBS 107.79 TaxID=1447943 RepID=A0A6A5VQR0_9PLEO|nr:hypothetical protein BU23DRAFT_152124 [Bimuria novae-zelandiae CBS 107.79]